MMRMFHLGSRRGCLLSLTSTAAVVLVLWTTDPEQVSLSLPPSPDPEQGPRASTPAVFSSRRRRYERVCGRVGNLPGHVQSVFAHRPTGVVYCHVPKAGCTFWKRVFNFVNNKSSSIFSTSRYQVHFNNTVSEPYNPSTHRLERYPTRILVARDPLDRVLSSYLDKLYLPDFWHSLGMRISRQARRREDSAEQVTCGKYVTFSEFVSASFGEPEVHWDPVHSVCNPCRFRPTHVSLMPTFSSDAKAILSDMGHKHVL
ncbi:hypothetical protein EGW08_008776, partial [Elysia chlorotica]